MHDLRSCARWQVAKPIKLKLDGKDDFKDCLVKDINFKGMQVLLKEKLPLDSYLRILIVLTESYVLNIEAWIAWHKAENEKNIYGIYFSKITDSDRQKIYQFISKDFPEELSRKWWSDDLDKKSATQILNKGGEYMQNHDSQDRRVFERFPVSFSARFLEVGSDVQVEARTFDISAKGVGLVARQELLRDTDLELWLDIPDQAGPLYARGKVAWSKEFEANEYRAGINLEKADLMGVSRALRAV